MEVTRSIILLWFSNTEETDFILSISATDINRFPEEMLTAYNNNNKQHQDNVFLSLQIPTIFGALHPSHFLDHPDRMLCGLFPGRENWKELAVPKRALRRGVLSNLKSTHRGEKRATPRYIALSFFLTVSVAT